MILTPFILRALIILLGGQLFCGILMGQDFIEIKNISILGNKKTRPEVILREMDFAEGDHVKRLVLEQLIEASRQNIFNLRLFNKVEIVTEEIDSALYVAITLKERWYIFPIPWVSIEERNSFDLFNNPDLHRISYGMWLDWKNVSGRNDRLYFYGQLGFSQRLEFSFLRPYIFPKQKVDMEFSFSYARQPEIIYGTDSGIVAWGLTETEPLRRAWKVNGEMRRRFSVRKDLRMEMAWRKIQVADSMYFFAPNYLSNSTGVEHYPDLKFIYANDQRDYKSFPLSGYKYLLFFRQAGLLSIGSTTFSKVGASWAQHIPLTPKWNLAYGLQAVTTFGRRLPWYEKSFVGINRGEFRGLGSTVRGYEPYAIGGTTVGRAQGELKYALLPKQQVSIKYLPKKFNTFPLGIYLTAFSDFGYISDRSSSNGDIFLKEEILRSLGIGLNVIGIYDNLLRIEFVRNHLGETGIYIHGSVSIK